MKNNPRWRSKRKVADSTKKRRAPKYKWTPEHYRTVVFGGSFINSKGERQNVPGLKSLAHGFDKLERDATRWNKAQRSRVRDYFHRVELLMAQEKRIVRPRSESNLRKLQDAFHGGVPSKDFKVAFMPDTEPVVSRPASRKYSHASEC